MANSKDFSHHNQGPFGDDQFGIAAERFARFLGSSKFIVLQTLFVVVWIVLNIIGIIGRWDTYPFILLNLMFSTQAAYAAPLILLAQTRQSDRDKKESMAAANHLDAVTGEHTELLKHLTQVVAEVHESTKQLVSSTQKGVN